MIPYGKHNISDEDISEVVSVLKSDWITQGPKVPLFESKVKKICKVQHAVAVNSATSALHISCMALGLGRGDRLWTAPNTFAASANCGLYCGAEVGFVDIDPKTYNICAVALSTKLKAAEQDGNLPKIVVVVHFSGQSCDMEAIFQLKVRYGFKIIEDASHCIGGEYKGQPIGNCHYSDITVFSFHPVKIVTSGEGGIAVTNSEILAKNMMLTRNHGITKDNDNQKDLEKGDWFYDQVGLGYNYRMTDIAASLGISQLSKLPDFLSARHAAADFYNKKITHPLIQLPFQIETSFSSWHLYVVQFLGKISGRHRKEIFDRMRQAGIGVQVHYLPVHLHKFYRSFGFREGDFPIAENYYKKCLTIPLFPGITLEHQELIVKTLETVLDEVSK
jgi:UDP-4-amino-4,6-dideoxy-N-acetyl-beta-L-altrosamine transaminase